MRRYPFKVPVTLSSFVVGEAPWELEENHIILPNPIMEKINEAKSNWQTLTLTQADLDSIDDDTWDALYQLIKPYLGS